MRVLEAHPAFSYNDGSLPIHRKNARRRVPLDLILAFLLFIVAMAASLAVGATMILPMILGLAAFALVALRRGFRARPLVGMCLRGMRQSLVVVLVMLMIGCLTALWRQCGTIAYFTYYGVRLVPPGIFVLAAFLLSSIMSYALGTSFGVAGTVGVILMTIARASGASAPLVGGAILSGLYFGDRGSPMASSASLVANETGTDVSRNFRLMLRSALLPMALCAVFYALLSLSGAPGSTDSTLLEDFAREFVLSPWCLLPTLFMLVLAFAGVKIKFVMAADILVSILICVLLQGAPLSRVLSAMLLGFAPETATLAPILSGGGVRSMLEIVTLLLLSSGCAGIFEGTHLLSGLEDALRRLSRRIGRFPAMVCASLAVCAVFCNQTIGIIMCRQCMSGNYASTPEGRVELMLDIENSVVVLAGLVPWCIACSVPLRMLGCDLRALPFAAYLYLLPLCWQLTLRLRSRRRA